MKRFKGKPLSGGYALGKAFLYGPATPGEAPRYTIPQTEVSGELARFEEALEHTLSDLKETRERALAQLGETESRIFDAHAAMLNDPMFVEQVRSRIATDFVNVEQAVDARVSELEDLLLGSKNQFLRERGQDVRDVGRRVLEKLKRPGAGRASLLKALPPRTILVAQELFPSDTLEMDRGHVVGIVTQAGAPTSHAAILARGLGIPLVTGIPNLMTEVTHGETILVDAQSGTVVLSPSEGTTTQFERKVARFREDFGHALEEEELPCETRDGVGIKLFGNIGRIEELGLIRQHRLMGIGLFRTEYLFLESVRPPTLAKHVKAMTRMLEVLKDLPVVVRTMDLGGDKFPEFIRPHYEMNPHMGSRGLRFALMHRNLFQTQLRAALRVSTAGDLRIMFPMVLGADDLQAALDVLSRAAAEERIERLPRVGVMVETPAAVFEIERILEMVDFVSIGTNDLTQFILAADRNATELIDDFSMLHPAVLKAIDHVSRAANRAGKGLSCCGESAGDPRVACLLLGMGFRELSMSPMLAARVHQRIRRCSVKEMEEVAERVLECRRVREVREIVETIGE